MAGVRTDIVPPMIEERGLPDNISKGIAKEYKDWGYDAHTPSHYYLKELLNLKDKTNELELFLTYKGYKKFKDGADISLLEEYYDFSYYQPSGGVIENISNEEMDRLQNLTAFLDDKKYYTRITTQVSYYSLAKYFWDNSVARMATFAKNQDNIRCVFWFDN